MADTVPPSEEKANFFRLSSLLIDAGKVALRSLFDHYVPPGNLQTHLRTHDDKLQYLKGKKLLKQSQQDLLFPSSTGPPVCSSTFDITLLIMLLRNLCGLRDNTTFNWGVVPASMDHTEEADIVRIREFRNTVQHTSRMSIEADKFENLWTEIKDVILRVERNVPNFSEQINKLKADSIDPQKEDYYKMVFREWEEKDKEMREDIDKLTTRMDATDGQLKSRNERLEELDRQDIQIDDRLSMLNERQEERHAEVTDRIAVIQQGVRERVNPALENLQSRSQILLEQFKSKRQAFFETRVYHDAKEIFDKSGLLVLVGNPGEGKSTIAVNLMLDISPIERCLILTDPDDWKDINWKSDNYDVILIDDIFGMKKLHPGFLMEWSSKLDTLTRIAQQGKVRFILTTQPYILEECKADLSGLDMFTSEEHIVHVRTADLSVDEMEKILSNLLEFHKKETNTLLVTNCVRKHRGLSGHYTIQLSIPLSFPECAADLFDFGMSTSEEHIVHARAADQSDDEMEKIPNNPLEFHKREPNTLLIMNCGRKHRGLSGLRKREQSIPLGFPECAALFSTDRMLYEKGYTFFKSPKKFFDKIIQQLTTDKKNVLSFFLVWANKTESLTRTDILSKAEAVEEVANDFGFELNITLTREIKDVLEKHSDGLITYTASNGSYSFSHNVIRDTIGLVASRKEPEATIKFSTKDFFMEFITVVQTKDSQDKFYVEPYLLAKLAEKVIALLNHHRTSYKVSRIKGQLKEVSTTLDLSILWHDVFQDAPFVEAFFGKLTSMKEEERDVIIGSDVMKISQKLQPYGLDTHELKLNLIGATLLMNLNADIFVIAYLKNMLPCLQAHLVNDYLESCLLFAIDKGNTQIVHELLRDRAKVTGNGLYMAAFNGRDDILELLLQHSGTDPDEKGQGVNGNNALIIASNKGHVSSVKCLLKYRADPNAVNNSNRRAIERALMHDNEDICELLVCAGTNLDFRSGKLSRSPLHIAADKGLQRTVAAMLGKGADVKKTDKRGQCAIHIAAMQGQTEVVRTLLDHDATQAVLRAKTYGKKSEVRGMTAFHYAARNGFAEIVELFLRRDVDPNVKNFFGHTPAYIAASFGHLNVLESLKDRANLNLAEKQGFTPLHVAVFRNREDVVKCLCSVPSVDVNAQDKFEKTPLHVAAEKGRSDIARLLLSRPDIGADVRMLTKNKDTVYHRRRYKKVKQMKPVLQAADARFANMTKTNKAGMSACGIAFKEDNAFSLRELLLGLGDAIATSSELQNNTLPVISDFDNADLFDNDESDFDLDDFIDSPDIDFHDSPDIDFYDDYDPYDF